MEHFTRKTTKKNNAEFSPFAIFFSYIILWPLKVIMWRLLGIQTPRLGTTDKRIVLNILHMPVASDTLFDVLVLSSYFFRWEMTHWIISQSHSSVTAVWPLCRKHSRRANCWGLLSVQWNEDIYSLSNILMCWCEHSMQRLNVNSSVFPGTICLLLYS